MVNAHFAGSIGKSKAEFIQELFEKEALPAFDLFVPTVEKIIAKFSRIKELFCDKYPIIIVDEFQDTFSKQGLPLVQQQHSRKTGKLTATTP